MNLSEAQQSRRARAAESELQNVSLMVEALCDEVQIVAADSLHLAGSDAVKNYQMVGPAARQKLKGILSYYRKKPKPFTSCVIDNTKRFGPEGAKKVCAVVKDLIENRTMWRKGGGHRVVAAAASSLSFDTEQPIDTELFGLLLAVAHTEYRTLLAMQVSPATVRKAFSKYRKPPHLIGGSIAKINADHIIVHAKGKKHKIPFRAKTQGQSASAPFVTFGSSTQMSDEVNGEPLVLEDVDDFATVSTAARNKLADSDFALPKQRKYIIKDRQHGANALARASGKPEFSTVKAAVCKRYSDLPACQNGKGS